VIKLHEITTIDAKRKNYATIHTQSGN